MLLLCLVTGAWAINFGLGTQAVTLWLDNRGASDTIIGLNHSIYYLGLALASLLVPQLFQRWGIACSALGLFVSGLSVVFFPWVESNESWLVCRFVSGLAGALSLIPLETIVSRDSRPDQRSRNFGFYSVALTLGGALGIWLGPVLFAPGDPFPFYLAAIFPLTAVLFLRLNPHLFPNRHSTISTQHCPLNWSENFLGFGTGWCQGFLEGGMLAFLLLYLRSLGMSADHAGGLMGVTMVGIILFQVPVGWLADRFGRLPVLLGCYTMVIIGLMVVPCCTDTIWVGFWLFILGACSGALYPLGLALLGDRVPEGSLVRAYAWFLGLESLGSQMGAAIMGKTRDLLGETSMFWVGLIAVVMVLILSLGFSRRRKIHIPSDEKHIEPLNRRVA